MRVVSIVLAKPIFPGRCQPSIFSAGELNFRVRDGNGWTLAAINTNYSFFTCHSRQLLYITTAERKMQPLFQTFLKFFWGGNLQPSMGKCKKTATLLGDCFECWRKPIFPGRCQPSIFGVGELNFRVRDGNGWTLAAINTNYSFFAASLDSLIIIPHLFSKCNPFFQKNPFFSIFFLRDPVFPSPAVQPGPLHGAQHLGAQVGKVLLQLADELCRVLAGGDPVHGTGALYHGQV